VSEWRPLPAGLDADVAYLVQVLRELKDRSGLSLDALAAQTAVSKSAWHRYLNGVKLPTRYAVETLGQLSGEPPDRLVALWQHAEHGWSGRAGTAPDVPPAAPEPTAPPQPAARPQPTAPPEQRARWPLVTAGIAAGMAVVALVIAAVAVGLRSHGPSPRAVNPNLPPFQVGCQDANCAGADSMDMACGVDAATYAEARIGVTLVELRISRLCQAGWARVSHSRVGDRVLVETHDHWTQIATVRTPAEGGQYLPTRMLPEDAPSDLHACLERGHAAPVCTPWGTAAPSTIQNAPSGP
jgi:hypothetical protein